MKFLEKFLEKTPNKIPEGFFDKYPGGIFGENHRRISDLKNA